MKKRVATESLIPKRSVEAEGGTADLTVCKKSFPSEHCKSGKLRKDKNAGKPAGPND
jgi:hypothetical protein